MKKALCFFGGVLLAAVLLLCAVLIPALDAQRFERALLSSVSGEEPSDLTAFAHETMRYLRGEKAEWEPAIPREGVSEAFRIHMAEVRGWVRSAPWIIGPGALLGVVLLWLGGFRSKPALLGVFSLAGLLAVILLWSLMDFESFWGVLHRVFIPGGIFPAYEPVMRLFPLSLFMRYITPVCLWALGLLGALFAGLGLLNNRKNKGHRT